MPWIIKKGRFGYARLFLYFEIYSKHRFPLYISIISGFPRDYVKVPIVVLIENMNNFQWSTKKVFFFFAPNMVRFPIGLFFKVKF